MFSAYVLMCLRACVLALRCISRMSILLRPVRSPTLLKRTGIGNIIAVAATAA